MSDAKESSETPPTRRSRVGCLGLGCVVFVPIFFLLMMAGIGTGLVDLGFTVLFGWISFLADTLPRISWDWGAIGAGVLCTGLIFFLGHRFLSWLSRYIATARGTAFSWPWRWTWCGLIGIALFFLVGMAVAGVAHQIGWIANSEAPLFEDRILGKMGPYVAVSSVKYFAQQCLAGTNEVSALRTELTTKLKEPENRSRWLPSGLQSLHLLMLVGSDAKVEGILIFPRDAEAQRKFGGEYVQRNDNRHVPANELRRFIETNESKLVAF